MPPGLGSPSLAPRCLETVFLPLRAEDCAPREQEKRRTLAEGPPLGFLPVVPRAHQSARARFVGNAEHARRETFPLEDRSRRRLEGDSIAAAGSGCE